MGVLDIKRRMRSINSTMQITKAMYLVSSAKLNKAKLRVEETRPYFEITTESVKRILSSSKGVNHPFLQKRDVKKTAFIIVTADRGLAGGYNSNVLKLSEQNINKETDVVIVMGSVGRDLLKRRGYNIFIGKLDDKEIDFIGERRDEKIYIQVAYKLSSEETIEREFGSLLAVKDHYPKYVVTMDEFFQDNIEGIKHIKLLDFLMEE